MAQPSELGIPKNRPTLLIEGVLGNRRNLATLLSQADEREDILDRASNDIAALDAAETGIFVKTLLNGLSRDDTLWNQDKRDGALELFPLVDFGKLRGEQLAQDYLDAIAAQNADSDPYGTIYSLLEAGKSFASYLPPGAETRERVNNAWNSVASNFDGVDKTYIDGSKSAVIESIPLHAEDLIGNPEIRLGWREQPRFEPREQELHDRYLEVTRKDRTFKFALWENTPDFRDFCKQYGVDLERFWNISNPDEVSNALAQIGSIPGSRAYTAFDRALQSELGLRLDAITPEQVRVASDEIVHTAEVSRHELLQSVGSFPVVRDRFVELLAEAGGKAPRARRAVLTQISTFLREHDVVVEGASIEQLYATFADESLMRQAEGVFNERQQTKRDDAATIERTFRLGQRPQEYSLISRRREDLFLGDLTGDCTAYHLNTGMNAWTVPVWLSNPGFNMFKITDQDKLIAKLGILLAVADSERPVVVVDSFEVGYGIGDESTARQSIRDGLSFLGQWAEGAGFQGVYVNNVSNSSGAMDLLNDTTERSYLKKLVAMGGLGGISELRQRLTGQSADERIYLQSESYDFEEEETRDSREQAELIREFEGYISNSLTVANAEDRQKIEGLARRQDWSGLFSMLVNINYPHVSQALGSDWERYRELLNLIEIDDAGNPIRVDAGGSSAYELPVYTLVSEQAIEEAVRAGKTPEDESSEDSIKEIEASETDELLGLIKKMEKSDLTPELALQRLYGQTIVSASQDDEKNVVGLNRRLGKLAI